MGRSNKKTRKFIIDEDGFVNVYVDGCCINPDKPVSASGYGIYWGPENRWWICYFWIKSKNQKLIHANIHNVAKYVFRLSSMK